MPKSRNYFRSSKSVGPITSNKMNPCFQTESEYTQHTEQLTIHFKNSHSSLTKQDKQPGEVVHENMKIKKRIL